MNRALLSIFMDKPSNNLFPEKQTWGTREELLLACAVHRYGTDNWSAVAMEVQKRSTDFQLFTPLSCQQKYDDLKRRFSQNDAGSVPDSDEAIPWLDQLKKLRVAELKRELQLYDISIVSLQLKVKRLTEEREKKGTENGGGGEEEEDRKMIKENEPESLTDKPDGGEESDRENWSVNESNSTDPKAEDTIKEQESVELVRDEPERVSNYGEGVKAAGEDSCNGSCGSAAKELERNSERVDSGEMGESVAESRERDSGDVQSSVSLSKKEAKREGPEEVEPANEEGQSLAATKVECVESQPLVECLQIIRSHKFGSFFERLETKETPNYRSLIRQHIDLETIRRRLEENWYSGSNINFFRDLLLLFNNAIVFCNKNSSEYISATELRQVVLKEMARQTSNPNLSMKEQSVTSPVAHNVKLDLQSSDSLLSKPNILAPLIACRKRSSVTAKRAVSVSSSLEAKKKEHTESSIDRNSVPSSVKSDHDKCVTAKKRKRDRSATGSGSSSKNRKTRGNTKTKKDLGVEINNDDSTEVEEEANSENSKRKNKVNVNAKKRSAEIFLSRITRSSPLKDFVISPENGKGERAVPKKKNGNVKVDAKKEPIVQKRSGGKQGEERDSPEKKDVRRPGKRGAFSEAVGAEMVRGKRRRGSVEIEASGLGLARKRSRK